jgi:hypothetical protein
MRDAVRSRQEVERGRFDPRDELRRYLDSPLAEGIADIVHYWGVRQIWCIYVKCLLNPVR